MPIDASIISGLRAAPLNTPQEMYAFKQSMDQNELANRLGGLKLEEAQRGVTENNALNEAYRGALKPDGTVDRNMLYSRVAGSGLGAKLPTIQKGFADADKASVDSEQAKFKLANERYGVYQSAIGALANDPGLTREKVLQTGQALVDQGILTAEMMAKATGNLTDDPTQLRQTLTAGLKSQLKPDQIFTIFAPKAEKIDNGASISFKDTNPNSPTFGQNIAGAPIAKEQSPDNRASVAASRENAAATRAVAASNVEAARIKGDRETEMKLADDYRAQSKGFKEVGDAYKQISATLDKATTSPAATLAAATKFMKLLDPGSVVRESELGMALAATGVLDRATNYVNTLKYGKVLTPAQTADFKNITSKIYEAAQSQQKAIDGNYRKQAETYKLRPEMIVQDLGQNTPATTPKPAAPLPKGWSVEVN